MLGTLEKEYGSELRKKSGQRADRETLEKLRALGYTVSPAIQVKDQYGPEDDLKTLLRYENKVDQAILLLNENRGVEKSVKLLHDVIEERKDFWKAYERLVHIYKSRGLIEDALKIMEDGYTYNPQNFVIVSDYGILLVEEKRLDKGIEVLKHALSLYDLDPGVWNYLGVAHWEKGKYQESLDYYNKALSLDSRDAIILNNVGSLYLSMFLRTKKTADLDQAVEYFKKAIERDPGFASAYNGLGGAYRIMGKIDEAIRNWEKSLEFNPDYDFSLYNLGLAHLEKGNKPRALECFQKYLFLKAKTISPQERKEIEGLIEKCIQ